MFFAPYMADSWHMYDICLCATIGCELQGPLSFLPEEQDRDCLVRVPSSVSELVGLRDPRLGLE